jgi:exonuclease SbcC
MQKEQKLKTIEEKRTAAELAFQRAEQRLPEITAKCAELQTRAVFLEWVRSTKPGYLQLTEKQGMLSDELRRVTDTLAQQRLVEEKAISDFRIQEASAAQVAERLKIHREELSAMQNLQQSIALWKTNQMRLTTVLQSEQVELKSLELLRIEERDLLPQVTALTTEEARLSRQIAEVDKSQSEIRTLVSQLQGHVHSGTCPLCGEDHGSKDQLVLSIQQHVAADAASSMRADIIGVRERVKQLTERVASNKQKQQAMVTQLAFLGKERSKFESVIDQFVNFAVKLGVTIKEDGLTPAEQIQMNINRIQQGMADLDRQNQEVRVAVEAARTTVANIKNIVAAKNTEVNDRKTMLARLQEELNHLRADPRLLQISLDIDLSKLVDLERLNIEHLSGLRTEATKIEAEVAKKKLEVGSFRQEIISLNSQLSSLRSKIANLQKTATQIVVQLNEAKLPVDANEETWLALIAEQSRTHANLIALRNGVSNLELAIDVATTAAALTTVLQNIRNKEKVVTNAEKKLDQHQPWLKYFEEVSHLVSSQQNEAIANFTHEYGPLTSVIQRRLRSVYGFDEIEIQNHGSTINVRVKRRGEELRPIDYFSQSQQQTLLLGLFLTAASSQTWSTFSPVFLDDPVTHFDDLNTYAFLDLIVGLLESEIGKRQFIISTCDEKFLQLARQKFHHLKEHAKFYRFSAIGTDGPIIDEIVLS